MNDEMNSTKTLNERKREHTIYRVTLGVMKKCYAP